MVDYRVATFAAAVLGLVGCGDGDVVTSDGPIADVARPDGAQDVRGPDDDASSPFEMRPYELFVPSGHDGTPVPLVVLLHGYGASGAIQEGYFQMERVAERETFLYAQPDGTVNSVGQRFWNATDACCDLTDTGVDDVAYLRALLDDVERQYSVDRRRVYFIGHSNGGFMAHRMACDVADRIAAIVSLAGATWSSPARCTPSEPVAVAAAHGTADLVVLYDGGTLVAGMAPYPSAQETVASWRLLNGCGDGEDAGELDLVADLRDTETAIVRATGCRPGGAAELWTIAGGPHIPAFRPAWAETVWAFFAAHPKPQ